MWLAQKICEVNSKTPAKRWKNETVSVGDHTHLVLSLKFISYYKSKRIYSKNFFWWLESQWESYIGTSLEKNLLATKDYEY